MEATRSSEALLPIVLCQFSWCRVPEYWNLRKQHCENIKSLITSDTLFSDISSDEETTTTAMLEVAQMLSKEVMQMMLMCFFYSCLPYKPSYAIVLIFISSHNSALPPLVDAKARQTSFEAMLHVHLRFDRPRTPAFCC
jgi:hypothetical protein